MWSQHLCSGNKLTWKPVAVRMPGTERALPRASHSSSEPACPAHAYCSKGDGAVGRVPISPCACDSRRSHDVMPPRAAVPIPVPYLGSWHWSVVLLELKANLYYLHSVFKKKKRRKCPWNPTSWHCTEVPSLMISKTLWVVCARTPPALWNPHDFSHIPTQAAEQLGPLFYVWLCQCDFRAPRYLVVSSCPITTNDGVWEEVGRAQEGRVPASIPLPFSGLPFSPVGWHPLLCFLRYPLNVSLGLLETSCSSAVAWRDCGNTRLGLRVLRGSEDFWTASLKAELLYNPAALAPKCPATFSGGAPLISKASTALPQAGLTRSWKEKAWRLSGKVLLLKTRNREGGSWQEICPLVLCWLNRVVLYKWLYRFIFKINLLSQIYLWGSFHPQVLGHLLPIYLKCRLNLNREIFSN